MADEILMKPGHNVDVCLVQQLERETTKFEAGLNDISNGVLSAGLDGDVKLMKLGSEADKLIFKVSLHMKRLLHAQFPMDSPPTTDELIKRPEIEVPIFDINFLNLWEFGSN